MIEDKITPLYFGKPEDFRWVGFGSGSGTNLRECAKVIKPALIFSDRPKASLLKLEELADVPKQVINGYTMCGSWKKAQGNKKSEAEYKRKSIAFNHNIVNTFRKYEEIQGAPFDLIVLGGYMRLVEEPLLESYKDKIINVHPADLSNLNGKNKRRLIGEDAVYDALKGGFTQTCSSVIMVDGGEDHGEILAHGPYVQIWDEFRKLKGTDKEEALREYANAHQTVQKVNSDWPALTTTLKLISEGRIGLGIQKKFLNEWRGVYLNGQLISYDGIDVQKIEK